MDYFGEITTFSAPHGNRCIRPPREHDATNHGHRLAVHLHRHPTGPTRHLLLQAVDLVLHARDEHEQRHRTADAVGHSLAGGGGQRPDDLSSAGDRREIGHGHDDAVDG